MIAGFAHILMIDYFPPMGIGQALLPVAQIHYYITF